MTCQHTHIRTIATHCFVAPVAYGDEENRAAHGGVTDTEECRACGAQRTCNVNWNHVETGPWGPSLAERDAKARRALEAARGAAQALAPAPVVVCCDDGRALRLELDEEAYLVATGCAHDDSDLAAALAAAPEFFEAACAARRAYLAAVSP